MSTPAESKERKGGKRRLGKGRGVKTYKKEDWERKPSPYIRVLSKRILFKKKGELGGREEGGIAKLECGISSSISKNKHGGI